jgi:RNA polymerase sigma factor (sigma-70 family)
METYESLVEIVREAGEPERDEALAKLIRQFEETAYRWAFEILRDRHSAQDVVQEAFIATYEHLDQLKDPAAFPAWFKRIVLTRCNRLTRRKHVVVDALDESADTSQPDPSDEVEERESKERIEQALRRLPERERAVTELFYLDDYSQHEIAERLAIPVTTVKKRLQYARKHLRGEYVRDEQFRCELGNDPLVTWLIGADDPYQSDLVEQGDGELSISIQSVLVEETIPIVFAGHGASEVVPPYGQIAWHPVR